MSETEARKFLVEALTYSNVHYLRNQGLTSEFLAGRIDIAIAALEMDSLAEMELCIAIELNTGISIVPGELREINSLNDIIKKIADAFK